MLWITWTSKKNEFFYKKVGETLAFRLFFLYLCIVKGICKYRLKLPKFKAFRGQ